MSEKLFIVRLGRELMRSWELSRIWNGRIMFQVIKCNSCSNHTSEYNCDWNSVTVWLAKWIIDYTSDWPHDCNLCRPWWRRCWSCWQIEIEKTRYLFCLLWLIESFLPVCLPPPSVRHVLINRKPGGQNWHLGATEGPPRGHTAGAGHGKGLGWELEGLL